MPDWPINNNPSPASVVWDANGLLINASNSSLQQILGEVSTETGTKVEGLSADQRVFGAFGPGKARGRFRWQLAALMLCAGFVLSLSTLIFKAFAVKEEFWATTFWMFAGEALFGATFLCIGRYRRQFFDLCKSNGSALIAINASNELINLGGGLANRYALIFAPTSRS